MSKNNSIFSLQQAMRNESGLTRLIKQNEHAKQMLLMLKEILPDYLIQQITPGQLIDGKWNILVNNAATATRLIQFQSAIVSHLQSKKIVLSEVQVKITLGNTR